MKKIFTLRSLVAAVVLCIGTTVVAQTPKATITNVDHEGYTNAKVGDVVTWKYHIVAENVTEGVTLGLAAGMNIVPATARTITPATLTKDELLAGVDVSISLTIEDGDGEVFYTLYGYSDTDFQVETMEYAGMDPVVYYNDNFAKSFAITIAAAPYSKLSTLIAKNKNASSPLVNAAGEFICTHVGLVDVYGLEKKCAFVQDETAGVVLLNGAGDVDYKVGDKFTALSGNFNMNLTGTLYFIEYNAEVGVAAPTVVASGVAVEPVVVASGDEAYEKAGLLVRLNDVTFAASTAPFAAGAEYTVSIANGSAYLKVFTGSDLIGTDIPTETVDVVGIADTWANITLRSKADIIAKSDGTALENVVNDVKATKVLENGQLYIVRDGIRYNVLGTKQ